MTYRDDGVCLGALVSKHVRYLAPNRQMEPISPSYREGQAFETRLTTVFLCSRWSIQALTKTPFLPHSLFRLRAGDEHTVELHIFTHPIEYMVPIQDGEEQKLTFPSHRF